MFTCSNKFRYIKSSRIDKVRSSVLAKPDLKILINFGNGSNQIEAVQCCTQSGQGGFIMNVMS